MKSSQQTILITGATAGIGRHAALHLAALGHHVIATGRSEAALESLLKEASGLALDTLRLDVTNADSIAAAAHAVDELTNGRGVDALVNNAGYGIAAPLEEVTDAELRAQYDTNVFGLMAVTRAFLPAMRERGSGRIVNVSSVGGRFTVPLFGAYNSTKYAVESLSDALRCELRPFGIEVALIEPGPIKSEFANRTMESVAAHASKTSPYAAVYARADKLRADSDAQAAGPEVVSAAIEHAITARRPNVRYVVPFKMRIAVVLLDILPTRVSDWIMRRAVGLTRENLLASSSAKAVTLAS